MRKIMDNIEDAAVTLKNVGEKAMVQAKETFDKVGDSIERAMDEAKEALGRAIDDLTAADAIPHETAAAAPKPLPFEEKLDQEVSAQVDAIRASQQAPSAFSDYITKKFGKDK